MTTNTIPPDTFPPRLEKLMDAKGFTQTSLAKKSGIDRSGINRMLKGTQQPRPYEIGLLAQCLGVSPNDLMAGLQLPPQVQRTIDRERERTEQLLAAEAARDEAVARANQLAAETERLQKQLELERDETRKVVAATETAWQKRLKDSETAHASKQKTSDTTVRNLKSMLERAATKMREDQATQVVLRRQIAAFQQQLAQERSAKAGAGFLGGLVGMAIGRAME